MPTPRTKPRKKNRKPTNRSEEPPCPIASPPSKPRVFVASSTPGLPMAKKIVEELKKEDIAQITLWNEAFPPGAIILDTLRDQAATTDFAVVLFTADDLAAATDGSKAPRDNCVFELGLFMGALGLEPRRSLLLRDKKSLLLSDLGGLIYIDLPSAVDDDKIKKKAAEENEKEKEEEEFIKRAVEQIKSSIKDLRYCFNRAIRNEPRIIPKKRLMDLEKRGENLMDSDAVEVLINTTQPMELNHALAKTVCENMSADVTYVYFFQADPGSIKFFSSLVGTIAASKLNCGEDEQLNIDEWRALMGKEGNCQAVEKVLNTMQNQLRIYFLPKKPYLEFCVHNASHKNEAICYLRHTADSFVEWFKGESAKYVADELRTRRFPNGNNDIVFQGTQGFELYGHANHEFLIELVSSTIKRFPKCLQEKAEQVCFGSCVKVCIDKVG